MAQRTAVLPDSTEPQLDLRASRRALVAGSVGNFIEWYEFGVYGFLATVIAANFFSASGALDADSLVATYASFAIAFFFRPLGAAIFGRIGDRIGRRPTLIIVLVLMAGATALVGLLPTYASIGIAAPILLTVTRMLQGLSAGGEFGGAVSVMTEFAPVGRRGLYGAFQSFTVGLGLLTGAGIATLLAVVLSEEALSDWGWRIPFLLALPLGAVALWLRLRLEETPSFKKAQGEETALPTRVVEADEPTAAAAPPARAGAGETARAILVGIGRIMGWSAAGYTFLVVMPSYLQQTLGSSLEEALVATTIANLGFTLAILPAGALSDRVGRRAVVLTGAILVVVLAFPLIELLDTEGFLPKALALLVAGAVVGLMAGPGPAMLSEMFATRTRYTGLGLAYSLSNAVFSGSAGLIITELIESTGNTNIPAWYVMVTASVSVFALLTLRGDDHLRALRD